MNEHTPGPWGFNRTYRLRDIPIDPERECTEFINASGIPIGCWVPYEWSGQCPDSALIAAAPELLATLKWIAQEIRWQHDMTASLAVAEQVISKVISEKEVA